MYNEGSEIMEGFICPICKSDERRLERLLQHFDEKHSEEKDLIQTFRDVFNIAKRKILNLDENESSKPSENNARLVKQSSSSNPFGDDFNLIDFHQDIGVFQTHTEYFKAIRNPRLERFATETNKLIIRLNKLLTNRPTDPQQIKQHEQNVSEPLMIDCIVLSNFFHDISSLFHGSMENW